MHYSYINSSNDMTTSGGHSFHNQQSANSKVSRLTMPVLLNSKMHFINKTLYYTQTQLQFNRRSLLQSTVYVQLTSPLNTIGRHTLFARSSTEWCLMVQPELSSCFSALTLNKSTGSTTEQWTSIISWSTTRFRAQFSKLHKTILGRI